LLTDLIIKHFFKDLDIYLTQKCVEENKSDCLAKDIIRDNLADILQKHKEKEILLIAHSMGTIVAYEVLIDVEDEVKIDSLITIGSPLGVPFIFEKLKNDKSVVPGEKSKLRVPDNILTEWKNLADLDDKIARSADMSKLFKRNSHNIAPVMEVVENDYESEGIENPHKSYGYLRTPEVAQIIDDFLIRGRNKFILWLTTKFNTIRYKFLSS
jgi:pimeloyl-ACP methyl ester carboxylesterase